MRINIWQSQITLYPYVDETYDSPTRYTIKNITVRHAMFSTRCEHFGDFYRYIICDACVGDKTNIVIKYVHDFMICV